VAEGEQEDEGVFDDFNVSVPHIDKEPEEDFKQLKIETKGTVKKQQCEEIFNNVLESFDD
jgi:hypothetical protein